MLPICESLARGKILLSVALTLASSCTTASISAAIIYVSIWYLFSFFSSSFSLSYSKPTSIMLSLLDWISPNMCFRTLSSALRDQLKSASLGATTRYDTRDVGICLFRNGYSQWAYPRKYLLSQEWQQTTCSLPRMLTTALMSSSSRYVSIQKHRVSFMVALRASSAYKFYEGKLYTLNRSAGRPDDTIALIKLSVHGKISYCIFECYSILTTEPQSLMLFQLPAKANRTWNPFFCSWANSDSPSLSYKTAGYPCLCFMATSSFYMSLTNMYALSYLEVFYNLAVILSLLSPFLALNSFSSSIILEIYMSVSNCRVRVSMLSLKTANEVGYTFSCISVLLGSFSSSQAYLYLLTSALRKRCTFNGELVTTTCALSICYRNRRLALWVSGLMWAYRDTMPGARYLYSSNLVEQIHCDYLGFFSLLNSWQWVVDKMILV